MIIWVKIFLPLLVGLQIPICTKLHPRWINCHTIVWIFIVNSYSVIATLITRHVNTTRMYPSLLYCTMHTNIAIIYDKIFIHILHYMIYHCVMLNIYQYSTCNWIQVNRYFIYQLIQISIFKSPKFLIAIIYMVVS